MAMITADPKDVPQVASFAFTAENLEKVKGFIANYPPGRQASAVISVLDLAQRQQGWLPRVAMNEVARILDMAPIRVYEIATFYTMFQLKPKGRYLLQVCTTTPCWLRGSDAIMKACTRGGRRHDLQRAGSRVPGWLRERAGGPDQRRFLRRPRRGLAREGARRVPPRRDAEAGPAGRSPDIGAGRRPDHLEE